MGILSIFGMAIAKRSLGIISMQIDRYIIEAQIVFILSERYFFDSYPDVYVADSTST